LTHPPGGRRLILLRHGSASPPRRPPQVVQDAAGDGGCATGVGLEILVLDDDGRIRIDYQFIEQ
jgi:hypothetical protein